MPKSSAKPIEKSQHGKIRQSLTRAEKLQQNGNLAAAERIYQRILKQLPDHIETLQRLAILKLQTGNQASALHFIDRALTSAPDDPQLLKNVAGIYLSLGELEKSATYAQKTLSRQADNVDALAILGTVYLQQGQSEMAIDAFEKALKLNPQDVFAHYDIARAQVAIGKNQEAINHFELALSLDPNLVEARLELGKIFLTCEPGQSQDWFSSVLTINPEHAQAHYWLGVQSQTMGRFEQATKSLEKAIKLQPNFSNAWYRLSINRSYTPGDQAIKKVEQRFKTITDTRSDDPELITLGFTLGRFFEQRGAYDSAFRYFQAANRIKSQLYRFDKSQHDAQINDVITSLDNDFFDNRRDWGNASKLPVFIVGMPRSGTTLVEQIIAAHPSVHGAGEPQFMQQLVASLKITRPAPAISHAGRLGGLDRQQIGQMARQYLEKLQALQPAANRILDKLPGNYLRLGVIFTLFPAARIIHCKRDPMDTCWSCYQQNFEQGLNFTNDLEHLGHAYRGYLKLMHHWHQLFTDRILDIEYEELLDDPDSQSRRLLEHCGLDWIPEVLDFANQKRPVATASLWQVRQPLYKTSIGRWKNYREHLEPLSRIINRTE